MDMETVSSAIQVELASLQNISRKLVENPELGFKEYAAHALITEYLEKKGFQVEKGYHLETAFRATLDNSANGNGPTVCIVCEYDALPQIGHACGHNLISEAGLAAAIAVKAVMTSNKLGGKLVVMGTPAEEGGGGKAILIRAGAFQDIDVALMVHPSNSDLLYPNVLAVQRVKVKYTGKESHASLAPWEGVNALDAAVACYNNISMMRQQMKTDWRVHGVITNGGSAPNIIPAETELQFYLRAPTDKEVALLKEKAINCFEAAAIATGCAVDCEFQLNSYDSFLFVESLQEIYKKHAINLGVQFRDPENLFCASTDMGNVSHVVPSIHPIFNIPTQGFNHTKEFAEAAASHSAQQPTITAATAMALTAIDVLRDQELLQRISKEFAKLKSQ